MGGKRNHDTNCFIYSSFLYYIALNGLTWYSLATGSNVLLPSVNIVDLVSKSLLPESGILPVQFLIIPLMVGAAVVGSFERRIAGWIKNKKKEQ